MSKVVVGMSVSVDGIAGGTDPSNFMVVHEAVLGWVFDLRSWRAEQGLEGGEDNQDSKVLAAEFERFGAQVLGRTMFDYGYPYWGETPPFHAPVFVVTHRAGERIEKQGGTSYTFVTDGIEHAIEQARTAAGDKDVLVAGGIGTARRALAARGGRRAGAARRAGRAGLRHPAAGRARRRADGAARAGGRGRRGGRAPALPVGAMTNPAAR